MPKLSFLVIFCLLLFSSGCSEMSEENKSSEKTKPGELIVGKPIISLIDEGNSHDKNETFSEHNDSKKHELNSKRVSNEKIIEEGLVVNGVPISNDFNQTEDIILSRLPPLDEDSKFTLIPFRDLTSFTYEVNWESDGMDFDFSAYSKRVPKEIRNKNGLSVAIEGFMIPTIVDENNLVKEFLLLPDQMSCCFGQTPEPNGWVVVSAPNGVEVLMDEVIRTTGEFTVEERWDEEFFVGLYHLTCNEITGPSL
jgi:hypothetical protein